MTPHSIVWKHSAQKELIALDKKIARRIVEAVSALAPDPYPAGLRKLAGTDHTYRIRVGDYRVVYSVINHRLIVEIIRVRHRKDVYKS